MVRKLLEVKIKPEIIKWAREAAGWSIEEISQKLRISRESYERIESGKKKPTFKQLERLANYFKRPVAVFFLPKPPEEPSMNYSFRILPKSETEFSKELLLAIRKARQYQSILNELMRDLGINAKSKVIPITFQNNPKEFALEERKRMGISVEEQFKWKDAYEAFNAWRAAVESMNIPVFQFKFPIEDARGFSLMDNEPSVIAVNSADNILARIFTLFHEYAHIALGITEIYVKDEERITDKKLEHWCDSFASEFLIPEKVLEKDKDYLSFVKSKRPTPEILNALAKKFKVSRMAILTRLRTLNLIDDELYKKAMQSLREQQEEKQKMKGFMTPPKKCLQEKGKQFISSVLQGREREIITTADLLEYLSVKLKHLDKIQKLVAR